MKVFVKFENIFWLSPNHFSRKAWEKCIFLPEKTSGCDTLTYYQIKKWPKGGGNRTSKKREPFMYILTCLVFRTRLGADMGKAAADREFKGLADCIAKSYKVSECRKQVFQSRSRLYPLF